MLLNGHVRTLNKGRPTFGTLRWDSRSGQVRSGCANFLVDGSFLEKFQSSVREDFSNFLFPSNTGISL
jgi:hypothetical protein